MVRRNPSITPFLRQLLPTALFSTKTCSAIHNVGKASTKSTGAVIVGVSVVFPIVDIIFYGSELQSQRYRKEQGLWRGSSP